MNYDWIDASEGIDLAKSKECMICRYWFLNHGFESQDSVCIGCHDLTMLSVDISDIDIITVKILIVTVLFITLANLKQLIYQKLLFLKFVGIYKNVLNFSLFKAVF